MDEQVPVVEQTPVQEPSPAKTEVPVPPVAPTEPLPAAVASAPEQTPPAAVEGTPGESQEKQWYHKRIDALTAQLRETQAKLEVQPKPAAQAQSVQQIRPEDIQREAVALAARMKFDDECNKAYQAGKGKYNDFDKVLLDLRNGVGTLTQMGPVLPPSLVEAALEMEDPAAVLYELGKDLDKAFSIVNLPPARQAVALTKFAAIATAPKTKVSSAPAPIKPVVGGTVNSEARLDDENLPIGEWIKLREKTAARR